MAKELLFGNEARQKLIKGARTLAYAVCTTLGPSGRNVVCGRKSGPHVTKDGVTVAREVILKDPFEAQGADLIRQASQRTADEAGDGTTTTVAIANEMLAQFEKIEGNVNVQELRRSLEQASEQAIERIKQISKPVEEKDIENIASISANDPSIGKIVAQAMAAVGRDGVVVVEQGNTTGVEVEVVKGMEFDRGYAAPHLVTDTSKMVCELQDVLIAVTDKRITTAEEAAKFLEAAMVAGKKNMLLVCEDIEGEALGTIVLNRLQGRVHCLTVKAPGFGERKKDWLSDICVLTGATLITAEAGIKNVQASQLGHAQSVTSTKDKTIIVGGAGKEIQERVAFLKGIEVSTSDNFEKAKLAERVAKLVGGVAVIKVGGSTEAEMKERKDRVDDAVAATKAAVAEGVVPGAGKAYIEASRAITGTDGGALMLMASLVVPSLLIADNSNLKPNEMLAKAEEQGVLDPAKVARCAIKNAVSAAIMVFTSECVIVDESTK
jgi:chaperonin GroEL